MTNEEAVKKDHDTRVEPFIELPLQALKIRRNLLLCCFFCCAIFFGATLDESFSGGGYRIQGLPVKYLPHVMLVITTYFWGYFLWLGWQTFNKWKLRRSAETRLEKMKKWW